MASFETTYYGLTRSREQGPEAQDWAATDLNWETVSKILKNFEAQAHTGTARLEYPGYITSTTNTPPTVAQATGGVLAPGTSLGFRLAYLDSWGLETRSTQEIVLDLVPSVPRPKPPLIVDNTGPPGAQTTTLDPVTGGNPGVPGGTYFYAITKLKTGGESAVSDLTPISVNYDQAYQVRLQFDSINSYSGTSSVASTTAGSPTVTFSTTPANAFNVGQAVSGAAIPANSFIKKVNSATSFDITQNAATTVGTTAVSWTDGTDKLHIYRSTGLDSAFMLIKELVAADPSQTQFIDQNIVSFQNTAVQPPTVSTFDATRKGTVTWPGITHPAAAKKLRVYVTQQPGLWSTSHLLKEIDLTTVSPAPATFVDYTGIETLGVGWPKEDGNIVSASPKINLGTETTGSLLLSATADLNGQTLNNAKFGGPPNITLQDGMFWYDSTASQFKGRLGGTSFTLGQAGAGFAHGAEEAGGHISANIKMYAGATRTVKDLMDIFYTSAGVAKNSTSTGAPTFCYGTNSTMNKGDASFTNTDLGVSITPQFSSQWVKVLHQGDYTLQGNNPFATFAFQFVWAVNGTPTTIPNAASKAIKSYASINSGWIVNIHHEMYLQLTTANVPHQIDVQWTAGDGLILAALGLQRYMAVEII